jgi:hypothetical protein
LSALAAFAGVRSSRSTRLAGVSDVPSLYLASTSECALPISGFQVYADTRTMPPGWPPRGLARGDGSASESDACRRRGAPTPCPPLNGRQTAPSLCDLGSPLVASQKRAPEDAM